MGNETWIVFVTCGVVFLIIMLSSWYRRKKLSERETQEQADGINRIPETVINGQRTFRVATVSRHDGLYSMDVYEIRLPRPNDPSSVATIIHLPNSGHSRRRDNREARLQPPPPFSTAINMPSPARAVAGDDSENVTTFYTDNFEESQVPPPRYDEVAQPVSSISGTKVIEMPSPTISVVSNAVS